MANEEHLAILIQSGATWNQWRRKNPEEKPDLRDADLSYVNLSSADLRDADLNGANLSSANLRHAALSGVNLRSANLRHADLSGGNLSYNDLSYNDLRDANLRYADLRYANLSATDLRYADLSHADLSHADLHYADLHHANLNHANLSHANLRAAKIGWTVFVDVDLSEVKGFDTIYHYGPSSIGIDTIYKSKGNIPYKFLLDAGVPKDDIPYLLSLAGKAIDFYSCFISYSSQDQAFAKRLHADLQAKGVRTWYAPEDLTIGEPFLLGIDKGIQVHDKLLLVLSENSVTSGWVQHEVLSALAKEQGKEPWVLFPVRLDETVMHTSVPWVNMIKQSRHIGDFTHWKDHDTYQKAFERLIRDLKMGEKG